MHPSYKPLLKVDVLSVNPLPANSLYSPRRQLATRRKEENQQQVRGKEKSHLKEGNIVHVAALITGCRVS
jgi:hypothetical protein